MWGGEAIGRKGVGESGLFVLRWDVLGRDGYLGSLGFDEFLFYGGIFFFFFLKNKL